MKYYILINIYSCPNETKPPEPNDLQRLERFVFCYTGGGGLNYIPNHQISLEERHRHDIAGVLLNPNMNVFMTREGDPKENPQAADGRCSWRPLGFGRNDLGVRCSALHHDDPHCILQHDPLTSCTECTNCTLAGSSQCLLEHTNGLNHIDYRNLGHTPWLNLFEQTRHLKYNQHTFPPDSLSGSLAIFWGLVALNIGDDIRNLEHYFSIQGHQLSLNANRRFERRTSSRAVAVSIYRDPDTDAPLEDLERNWAFV